MCSYLFQLDERLRLLKDDNNKIEHGTNADRKENNGILGHWGGEQEWKKQGPKKQRKAKYGEEEEEEIPSFDLCDVTIAKVLKVAQSGKTAIKKQVRVEGLVFTLYSS
jgi:hypothetical protein